jgi:hypothetical protein
MLTEAEIAGYMNWRGPGAYTAATMKRVQAAIAEAVRREREAILDAIDEADNCGCGIPCDCFGVSDARRVIKMRYTAELTRAKLDAMIEKNK